MRELKLVATADLDRLKRRTPPGVRELKHVLRCVLRSLIYGRTPPGVRELKLSS